MVLTTKSKTSTDGRRITPTARVTIIGKTRETPAKSVSLIKDRATLGTARVRGGNAKSPSSKLPIRPEAIRVVYSKTADQKPSHSAALIETSQANRSKTQRTVVT
jgi:hypothetical protein